MQHLWHSQQSSVGNEVSLCGSLTYGSGIAVLMFQRAFGQVANSAICLWQQSVVSATAFAAGQFCEQSSGVCLRGLICTKGALLLNFSKTSGTVCTSPCSVRRCCHFLAGVIGQSTPKQLEGSDTVALESILPLQCMHKVSLTAPLTLVMVSCIHKKRYGQHTHQVILYVSNHY